MAKLNKQTRERELRIGFGVSGGENFVLFHSFFSQLIDQSYFVDPMLSAVLVAFSKKGLGE